MSHVAIISRRIESERVRLENLAVEACARVGTVALRHAVSAVRIGSDPIEAVRDVLEGNQRLGLAGLEGLIARALVSAHLLGLRRTALTARQHFGTDVLELSRSGDELSAWLQRLTAAALVAESEVVSLFQRARAAAKGVIQRMTRPLLSRVAAATASPAMPPPLPPREPSVAAGELPSPGPSGLLMYLPSMRSSIRELGTQFEKAGFIPGAEHGIAAELSGGMVRSYESGRARGWRMTPVREKLWGFHYSAVLDDVTTELCRGLDGTTLPMDDVFWLQWTPPNHWNCRSCVIEVWESSKLREPPASLRNYERFGADFFVG